MGDLPIEPILVSQSLCTLHHHLGELSPSLRFLWHKFHLCLFFQLTGPGKRHNVNSEVMRTTRKVAGTSRRGRRGVIPKESVQELQVGTGEE